MVKLLKNHLSFYAFTTAILFFIPNVNARVQSDTNDIKVQTRAVVNALVENGKNQFTCNVDAPSYRCKTPQPHQIFNKKYQKSDQKADETIALEASGKGTSIHGKNITISGSPNADGSKENFWEYSVVASDGGKIHIKEGVIDFTNGVAVKTVKGGAVFLNDVSITGHGQSTNSENSAFYMFHAGGYIDFSKGKVDVTGAHGILSRGIDHMIYLRDTSVAVRGSDTFYGVYFLFDRDAIPADRRRLGVNVVHLTGTSFIVPNSTAVYSTKWNSFVRASKGSILSGDVLVKADGNSRISLSTDASILKGGARIIDGNSIIAVELTDNSKWILSQPKYEKLQSSDSVGVSSILEVELSDSSIVFEKLTENRDDGYQTLQVGEGHRDLYRPWRGVYRVKKGDAHLYLNTYLNKGGALQNQKTDRVLIYGDVEGKTTVHVQIVPGSPGEYTGSGGNDQGISLIQVSGKAEKDSFRLNNDYVTMDGLPYQYRLYAYGPESTLGKANPAQRLVKGEGEFWDFRLENRYVGFVSKPIPESRPLPYPESSVKAVVPQVPIYLLLPNSVFHAGLMDINNQNRQLEILRTPSSGMVEMHEKPTSFLRGYGGSYRYVSDLSALEYGYGGDLSYNAVEAGILLHTIENANTAISFGVMGTYGKLSLQPVDVEQSQKSTFDKWTATAYGSMQHDAGFYVDSLLSYGVFKGDVVTLARGKTATLKANPFSVSLTGGKAFATGYEGFVVEPQVQVVYQHLHFDKAYDIDKFDIEMGKLGQWVARVGGRLSKMFSASEKERDVSMYGKLYFTHAFEEKQTVHFKDAFQLGAFGSSLEAGLGFNAKLSQKFALHADLSYQHQLNKAGFSGISFSGGLRYRF
ncbi:outer membrane autotransporter barrel domain-containing protein [Bartonella vinsonii subsp. arupensis OK-94-513]|uniref:Outer membrane autotransporter barrel domain-containing protein n=1 Tax=Bartonella vinsonii subsp. arupensis OK-94-513 TaxID=1094562 RepID=J0QSP3_BARVI|nr:autotransporter outer membrane beta-barrel domain-containing protein [Bartonella vinsonii]EJF86104.1 outer membrane autotransporter barrel domain-containing protein [Bartonella vinsonii subsp. arupensis OK-94-513]